jgi:hypothetical protein
MTAMTKKKTNVKFFAGALLQMVAMGFLLFVATVEIFSMASDTQIFRYQGF